jgi:transposase
LAMIIWYNAPIMHVEEIKTKSTSGKIHSCFLLRETRREGSKTIKATVANISHLPLKEIEAIKYALKYKQAGIQPEDIEVRPGKVVGSLQVVAELMKRNGILDVLGSSRKAALCRWLIFARLAEQGSRLSSVRLAERYDTSILGLNKFDEDDLYEALDWLGENQESIQQTLFKRRYGNKAPDLFLYDVSSSYLEGMDNELGWWGYNRDGKKGKQQIVFGLLTDQDGEPIAVEVFEGNTADQSTFVELIKGFGQRFGVKRVTFVGDRGMIKSTGIEELHKHEFFYITAITKPQIMTLLKDGVIQLGLFDGELGEVSKRGVRYILRRNPVRAEEMRTTRESKLAKLKERSKLETEYLKAHPHASTEKAEQRQKATAKRLVIEGIVKISTEERKTVVEVLDEELKKAEELDGCYVLKTDLPESEADKELVHRRYKDLAKVEKGFRTIKTGLLEVRPIWLRRGNRTRAHVFICMLAYLIARKIEEALDDNESVSDVLQQLNRITKVDLVLADKTVPTIPTPPPEIQSILKRLNVFIQVDSRVPSKKANKKIA